MVSPVYIRIASSRQAAPKSLLTRVIAGIVTVLAVVAVLMFSVVALGVLLVGGAVFLGYFWWKTRALRRSLREQAAQQQATQQTPFARQRPAANDDSVVIEGVSIRVVSEQEAEPPRR